MLSFGLIDGIVREPLGGAHNAPEKMAMDLRGHIMEQLAELMPQDPEVRIVNRIHKYEQMGRYTYLSALEEAEAERKPKSKSTK